MANEPVNFYQLLRQRIAEHAERDLSRYHIDLKVPEPKTPPRQRKWLDKFKAIHGMSYSTWLYKKQHSHHEESVQTPAPMTESVEASAAIPQETPTPVIA